MATNPLRSANDQIASEFTTHTINVLRVAASLQKPVLAELERLEKSLAAEVAKLPDDPTSNKLARLNALLAQTRASITASYQKIGDVTQKGLAAVAKTEQQKAAQVVNKGIGASVMTVAQTEEQLQTVASGILLTGRFPAQWWAAQDAALKGKFEAAMRDGIARGEGVDKLIQRVRGTKAVNFSDGIMAVPKYQAEALVRTAVQTASNHARLLSFEKNAGPGGVIKAIQWRSTLDSRTTPICIKLNGKQWTLPGYDPIDHDEPFPGPIAHWNCRSTQVAVTKSWAELAQQSAVKDPQTGASTDLETKIRAEAKDDGKSAAQADDAVDKAKTTVDGKPTDTETADEFLGRQSPTDQNALLGPQQAEMYRQGKLKFEDVIDQKNRPLPVEKLQEMVDKGHSVPVPVFQEGQSGLGLAERALLNESHNAGTQDGKVLSHFMDTATGQTVSFDGTAPSPAVVTQAKKFQGLAYLRNGLEKGAVFTPQEYNLMASLPNFQSAKLVNPSGRVLSVNVKPGQTFTPPHALAVNEKMDALKNTKNMGMATKMGLAVGSKDVPSVSFRDHGVGAIHPPPPTDIAAAKQAQQKAEAQAAQDAAEKQKAVDAALVAKKAQDAAEAAKVAAQKQADADAKGAQQAQKQVDAEAKAQANAQKVIAGNGPDTPLGKHIAAIQASDEGLEMKPTELLAASRAAYKTQIQADKDAKEAAAAAKKQAAQDAQDAKDQAEIAANLGALAEINTAMKAGTPEAKKLVDLVNEIKDKHPSETNSTALEKAKAQIASENAAALAKEQALQKAAQKEVNDHMVKGTPVGLAINDLVLSGDAATMKDTEILAAAKAKVQADAAAAAVAQKIFDAKEAAAKKEINAAISLNTPEGDELAHTVFEIKNDPANAGISYFDAFNKAKTQIADAAVAAQAKEQSRQDAAADEIAQHSKAKTPFLADAIAESLDPKLKATEILAAAKVKAAAAQADAAIQDAAQKEIMASTKLPDKALKNAILSIKSANIVKPLKPADLLAQAKQKVAADNAGVIAAEQATQDAAQATIDGHIASKTPFLADAIQHTQASLQMLGVKAKPTEVLAAATVTAQQAKTSSTSEVTAKKELTKALASKTPEGTHLFDAATKIIEDIEDAGGTWSYVDVLNQAKTQVIAEQAAAAATAASAKTAAALANSKAGQEYAAESKGCIAAFGEGSPAYVAPINGIPFNTPPLDYWLLHKDVTLPDEPALPPTKGKAQSTGVIFVEDDGSVWLYSPLNDFGGYKNTWSKGRAEPGLTLQQNALKEANEELGLTGTITGYLGDFAGGSTMTRFYIGKRTGGEPWTGYLNKETDYVKLATPDQARKLFNVPRDKAILDALLNKLNPPAGPPAGKAVATPGFPTDPSKLKKLKDLGGTTGAYLAEDPATGAQYVVKKGGAAGGDPANHLREEFTTDQLYRSMGAAVPDGKLYDTASGPIKVTKFLADSSSLGEYLANATPAKANAARAALRANFVLDALLGNWDVMGASNDNVRVTKDGTVYRIDNGGGLRYRAQGKLKTAEEWNQGPQELWSLRRQDWVPGGRPILPGNRDIFGTLSILDIAKQIRAIPDATFQKALTDSGAPPEVRAMLVKRMAAMRVVADKAMEATKFDLKLPYTEELTRRMVDLRSEGVVERMSKKFDNPPGNTSNVMDEHGKAFDELRSTTAYSSPVPSATAPGAPKVIFPTKFDKIAIAVKTVVYHAGKGDALYNPTKLQAALDLEPVLKLTVAAPTGVTAEEKVAAQAYLDALTKLKAAVALGKAGNIKGAGLVIPKVNPVLEAPVAGTPPPPPKPASTVSITGQVWAFITKQGGNPAIINDWMGSQAGSSWSQEAQAYKYYLTTMLDQPDSAYWWKKGKPAAKTAYDAFVAKYTLPAIEKTMQIWHAYNQEILGNTIFRYNDTKLKVVRLIRTELDVKTMGQYTNAAGQKYYEAAAGGKSAVRRYAKNIKFTRGGNESSSIFKDKYPMGSSEVTVQAVPHVRVTGVYFTDRLDRIGSAGFAGDSENEFTFMTAGLPFDYTGHQGAIGIDLDGGSDATKWGIDLAHVVPAP